MELIAPEDPQYFTQTSDESYDRHHYKIISTTGESIKVDNWMKAQEISWNKKSFLSHIEVLDKKQRGKGF